MLNRTPNSDVVTHIHTYILPISRVSQVPQTDFHREDRDHQMKNASHLLPGQHVYARHALIHSQYFIPNIIISVWEYCRHRVFRAHTNTDYLDWLTYTIFSAYHTLKGADQKETLRVLSFLQGCFSRMMQEQSTCICISIEHQAIRYQYLGTCGTCKSVPPLPTLYIRPLLFFPLKKQTDACRIRIYVLLYTVIL